MPSFIKSANSPLDWINDDVLEICFIGRSNVGKSSLINLLAKQKIAFTSKTPGRTQTVNFYDFNKFRVVDLPGYGYAKVNDKIKKSLILNIDQYLSSRKNLFAVFQICDANVITDDDVQMSEYLQKRFIHHYVLLNKADKQNISIYKNNLVKISKYLKVPIDKIFIISVKNNLNINLLTNKINELLKIK